VAHPAWTSCRRYRRAAFTPLHRPTLKCARTRSSKCLSTISAQSRTNRNQLVNTVHRLRLLVWPRSKRRRAAALHDAKAFIPRLANARASWSAPVLWRFPSGTQKSAATKMENSCLPRPVRPVIATLTTHASACQSLALKVEQTRTSLLSEGRFIAADHRLAAPKNR
jgi:hypothetical protein